MNTSLYTRVWIPQDDQLSCGTVPGDVFVYIILAAAVFLLCSVFLVESIWVGCSGVELPRSC